MMEAQKRAREAATDLFLAESNIPGYEPADLEYHWVPEKYLTGFVGGVTVAVE